ncbi:MAG: DUF4202 domain-containing protein [Candidatus Methylumidiphilus sp.]
MSAHEIGEDSLSKALALVDEANREDPNTELWQGEACPKEWLYGLRMSAWLAKLDPDASPARQLAARAQHIRRWTVPRESYPEGREGYLRWRKYLYGFHAEQAAAIAQAAGFDAEAVAAVQKMVGKDGIKRDADVQIIEDTACLVFLEHYFPDFAAKHEPDKLADIVRKTWKKMSASGQQAALGIHLPDGLMAVVAEALGL